MLPSRIYQEDFSKAHWAGSWLDIKRIWVKYQNLSMGLCPSKIYFEQSKLFKIIKINGEDLYNRPFVRTNFGATRFKVQMYKFVHLYSVVYKFVHLYFCTFVLWCNTKFVHLYVQIQICTFVLLYICTLVQSPPKRVCKIIKSL